MINLHQQAIRQNIPPKLASQWLEEFMTAEVSPPIKISGLYNASTQRFISQKDLGLLLITFNYIRIVELAKKLQLKATTVEQLLKSLLPLQNNQWIIIDSNGTKILTIFQNIIL